MFLKKISCLAIGFLGVHGLALDLADVQAMYYGYGSRYGHSYNNSVGGIGEGYGFSQLHGYGYTFGASRPVQGVVDGYTGYRNHGYSSYGYGNSYQPNSGMSTRYNDGGYGDKNYANFNLSACTEKNQKNCTAQEPGAGEYEWRFVPNIGWRKLASYDAARKDWWDYKRSVPLPFNYFNFPRF